MRRRDHLTGRRGDELDVVRRVEQLHGVAGVVLVVVEVAGACSVVGFVDLCLRGIGREHAMSGMV